MRAASLVYATLLSLVPLLAFSFALLKGFGAHNLLEPFLLNSLAPLGEKAPLVTQQVIGFVENIKVGVLGAVGLGVLLYTVFSLMHKVTLAIDVTWNQHRRRNPVQQLGLYFTMLLLGPFLIFAVVGAMTGAVESEMIQSLLKIELFGRAYEVVVHWIPLTITAVAMAITYRVLPGAKVEWWAAVAGGILAASIWKLLGWGFALFVAGSSNYTAIYSAFATLLILLIWLNLSWLTFLLGSRFVFFLQYPEAMRPHRSLEWGGQREVLSLQLVAETIAGFNNPAVRVTDDYLLKQLGLHQTQLMDLVTPLVEAGVIQRTDEEESQYLPAAAPEAIRLSDVLLAVRGAQQLKLPLTPAPDVIRILEEERAMIAKHFGGRTLADLLPEHRGDKAVSDSS